MVGAALLAGLIAFFIIRRKKQKEGGTVAPRDPGAGGSGYKPIAGG